MTRDAKPAKMAPLRLHLSALVFGAISLLALAAPAVAQQVAREQDILDLRLGQRVLVDDGSCPAGQIKEVSGATMSPAGIVRVRKCVPRVGVKKR